MKKFMLFVFFLILAVVFLIPKSKPKPVATGQLMSMMKVIPQGETYYFLSTENDFLKLQMSPAIEQKAKKLVGGLVKVFGTRIENKIQVEDIEP